MLDSTLDGASGQHVGYVDTSGTFTDLTPASSNDYASIAPKHTSPVFNPVTGRLWFVTPGKLGSVDPAVGTSSSTTEPVGGIDGRFYFTPDGKTPLGEHKLRSRHSHRMDAPALTMTSLSTSTPSPRKTKPHQ